LDEKGSDNAGLSDSKKLWFLARTASRLCAQLGVPTEEPFDTILPELEHFVRDPSDYRWRMIFHAVEGVNTKMMVELAVRDPLSAKAYRAGKLLAQLFWVLPPVEEVQRKIDESGRVDAYTLLRGLETGRMSELIGDLRELEYYLAEGTFPALASSISAWEIKGMLYRDPGGRLKLRGRPRLPGLRLTIVHLPVIGRLFRRGRLRRIRPKYPAPKNIKLWASEAGMIWQNLRIQTSIWRGLVFETRGPRRLLKPSDWFRINFVSGLTLCLGALMVATSLAAIGLGLVFFAGPGVFELALATYGDEDFEGLEVVQSLSAGPLLTVAGGVLAKSRDVANAVRDVSRSIRTQLSGNAIRRHATRGWNRRVPKGQRLSFVRATGDN
jgi:hypothetical protein